MHQEIEIEQHRTILEESLQAFAEIQQLQQDIAKLTSEVESRTDYDEVGLWRAIGQSPIRKAVMEFQEAMLDKGLRIVA